MRLVIIFVFLNIKLIAQNWEIIALFNNGGVNCLYADTLTGTLIIGGQFRLTNGDSTASVVQFDGMQLLPMSCGIDWDCNEPYLTNQGYKLLAIQRFNDKLFATGQISEINGVSSTGITYWDGINWNVVNGGLSYLDGAAGIGRGIALIETNLFVLGSFENCSESISYSVCKFNENEGFASIGFPNFEVAQTLTCAAQFQGVNYFAGRFNNATTPFNGDIFNIIKYENGQWTPVGEGIRGGMSAVEKMVVFQDKLYVAGVMSKSAGAPGNAIAAWDGQQWDDVGGGLYQQAEAHIYDMKVYNGKLYVVGTFSAAGGVPVNELAVWDGVNWCRVETDVQDHLNLIRAIEFYHDTLYLAGTYSFNVDTIAPERRLIKHLGTLETIQCGNLTSVEDLKTAQIILFPNPTNGIVNLSFGKTVNGNLTVNNLMGQILINEFVNGENTTLDLSNFSSGIYVLRFVDELGKVISEKIVVE